MRDYNINFSVKTLFLARLVKITRLDGFVLRIAEAEETISFVEGGVFPPRSSNYVPLPGAEISAVKHLINGDAGSMEIRFAHSQGGTLDTAQLNNGFWDGATVQVYLTDRSDPSAPSPSGDAHFTGLIDSVRANPISGSGSFDIRGLTSQAEAMIQTFQPMCRTDLFSPLCQLNEADWDHAGTVDTIVDRFNFTVAGLASPPADGWFNQGTYITAHGFKGVVANWVQGTRKITAYQPECIARLTAGESITLYPGCDKTAATCKNKFNNRINHQAEAHFLGIKSIVGLD